MISIHRLGLVAGGLAASLTVAGALVVQGYVGAQTPTYSPQIAADVQATDTPAVATMPPQTIYILPPATLPPTTQPQPTPVVPDPTPPVIHVIVPSTGEPGEGIESENN
jgi:hypothetical protein